MIILQDQFRGKLFGWMLMLTMKYDSWLLLLSHLNYHLCLPRSCRFRAFSFVQRFPISKFKFEIFLEYSYDIEKGWIQIFNFPPTSVHRTYYNSGRFGSPDKNQKYRQPPSFVPSFFVKRKRQAPKVKRAPIKLDETILSAVD